ncbi:MAG: ATP-binding protein [Elusimicrobia bacterium]|nr:ATP-binding protein [Elusimicrobiota bacterium]
MRRETLNYILTDQRQETARLLEGAILRRHPPGAAEQPAKRLATVITGVRRCGKSVYAHQLCRGSRYAALNFDDERLTSFGPEDFDLFLQAANELEPGVTTLLMDEIQNIPHWELFINRLLRKGYRCVITGSNARLLSRELATHLTGRTRSMELYPFSLKEFLEANLEPAAREETLDSIASDSGVVLPPEKKAGLMRLFDQHLEQGGFPETVIATGEALASKPKPGRNAAGKDLLSGRARYLRELHQSILLRDIAARRRLRETRTLQEVALFAISQAGSRITYQKTARSLGLKSVTTAKKYLEALEEVYLAFQVLAHCAKPKEILRQARKLYPIDLGLLSALSLKSTPDWGARLETFVFLELKRRGREVFTVLEPGYEVDFLVREVRRCAQLIQVCYRLSDPATKRRELSALVQAARLKGCRELLVITHDEQDEIRMDGLTIRVLPAWRWALDDASR